jgi:hypothetical protein
VRDGDLSGLDYEEPPNSILSHAGVPLFTVPIGPYRVRPSESVVEASPHHPLLESPPADRFENPFRPDEPDDVNPDLDLGPSQRSRRMSIAEKIRIIELRHAGRSFDYIADELDRSQSACSTSSGTPLNSCSVDSVDQKFAMRLWSIPLKKR